MTQLSESKTRSVATIGDSCVILSERGARAEGSLESTEILRFAQDDNRARRSRRAIGDGCVIPGERKRDPGSSVFAVVKMTLDSRWRGNDGIEDVSALRRFAIPARLLPTAISYGNSRCAHSTR